jgi:hypothetical protein
MDRHIITVAVSIVLLIAALLAAPYVVRDESGEVIARVEDQEITRHEVDARVRQKLVEGSRGGGLSVPEDALFDQALNDLILEALLYQDAVEKGYTADPQEVEERYAHARSQFESESAFLERMEENLLTPETFRENIARQIVRYYYLLDIRRAEIEEELNTTLADQETETKLSVSVDAENIPPLTNAEVNELARERAEELKDVYEVEVYLD